MRFLLLLISTLLIYPACAEVIDAKAMLEKNYLANRLADSDAEIRMTLRNESGKERVRELRVKSKLQPSSTDGMFALVFSSPADIKDAATLLIQRTNAEDDMWVYLPALRKSRRLLSDNKRDSFMGSDLSYGDIIGHRPGEWAARLLREDVVNGMPVYVIEALPATDAIKESSGYSKRVISMDKTSYVALKMEFWDDMGNPLKIISVSDVKSLPTTDKKYQFMQLEADQLQTHNHTTLIYNSFEFNKGIPDALFTQRAMEKGFE